MNILVDLRALELFNLHYQSRPHIKTRDYGDIEFYRRVAQVEADGLTMDHEALRREMGGSFD